MAEKVESIHLNRMQAGFIHGSDVTPSDPDSGSDYRVQRTSAILTATRWMITKTCKVLGPETGFTGREHWSKAAKQYQDAVRRMR